MSNSASRYRIKPSKAHHTRFAVFTIYDTQTGLDVVSLYGGTSLLHACVLCTTLETSTMRDVDPSLIDAKL